MIDALSPLLAFLAGLLSILSPCVLPLIPIVFATAGNGHWLGPAALAAGLAITFTAVGLFIATVGFSIGMDDALFRTIGGVLLVVLGAVLLVRAAESGLGASLGLVSRWANGRLDHFAGDSLPGQAVVGALLGLVWVPCIGPTLGAASMLAAQKESLDQVALVMMSFGIGAAVPLAAIGGLSGRLRVPLTGALRRLWTAGKPLLGTMLVAVGVLVVSGLDRSLEASLTAAAPDWLIALTTRY